MLLSKLKRDKNGTSEVISSILMVSIAVIAMLVVTSFSQTVIDTHKEQMGERLLVEKVMFNSTYITVYVRNIGYGNIILEQAKINDILFPLDQGRVTLPPPEGNPESNPTVVTVKNNTVFPTYEEGSYDISFISLLNKDLGAVSVKYGFAPSIMGLTPPNEDELNETMPQISANVTDSSQNGIEDLLYMNATKDTSIIMKIDEVEVEGFNTTIDYANKVLVISYQPTVPLDVTFHTVYLEVRDSQGSLTYKSWWFEIIIE